MMITMVSRNQLILTFCLALLCSTASSLETNNRRRREAQHGATRRLPVDPPPPDYSTSAPTKVGAVKGMMMMMMGKKKALDAVSGDPYNLSPTYASPGSPASPASPGSPSSPTSPAFYPTASTPHSPVSPGSPASPSSPSSPASPYSPSYQYTPVAHNPTPANPTQMASKGGKGKGGGKKGKKSGKGKGKGKGGKGKGGSGGGGDGYSSRPPTPKGPSAFAPYGSSPHSPISPGSPLSPVASPIGPVGYSPNTPVYVPQPTTLAPFKPSSPFAPIPPSTPIAPTPTYFAPGTPIAPYIFFTEIEFEITDDENGEETLCPAAMLPANPESEVDQLIEWEFELCLDGTVDVETVSAGIQLRLNEALKREFLTCDFTEAWNLKGILLKDNPACTSGANCYTCTHDFTAYVVRLPETARRKLVETAISDSTTITEIGSFLNGFSPNLDGVSSITFSGLSNSDADAAQASSNGNSASAVSSGDSSPSAGDKLVVPGIVVASAMLFLVAIAVVAVKRSRDDSDESYMSPHVPLKDDDEYSDDLDTDGSSISTGGIIKDLAAGEEDDEVDEDAEVRTSASESVPLNHARSHVVGEGENSTFADEDSEIRFLAGEYPGNGVGISTPAPTFVTTDLKRAMKDLEPPSSLKQARGYIHDDTVDL